MKKFRLSLFWRCFFTYLISTFIFLGVHLYSFNTTTRSWQESYVKEIQNTFQHNCDSLSSDFLRIPQYLQVMNISGSYSLLSKVSVVSEPKHSYYISETMADMSALNSTLNLADDVVIYLNKPGIFITSSRYYPSASVFTSAYRYESADLLKVLEKKRYLYQGLEVLPCEKIQIKEQTPQKYLTCILGDTSENCTYLFLISEKRLVRHFQLDTLPKDTSFQLTDNDGAVLFSYGDNSNARRDYSELSSRVSSINCAAALNLPGSFFENVTSDVKKQIITVTLFSIVFGLLLCIIFSRVNVKPIQDLIRSQQIPEEKQSKNEVVTIYNYLSESREQHAAIKKQLISNILARLFSGLSVDKEELHLLADSYALMNAPARIAIVRYRKEPENKELKDLMIYQFWKDISEKFIIEPINTQEIGIILPADGASLLILKKVIEEKNTSTEQNEMICGVSSPFVGCSSISDAISQARFSLPENHETFSVFKIDESGSAEPDPLPDLMDFQNALFNWNSMEINDLIMRYASAAIKENAVAAQSVFYSLLALIKNAAKAVNIPTDFFDECSYARSISGDANIRGLKVLTDYLFQQRFSHRTDEKELRRKEMTSYISEHYGDSALSVSTLSDIYKRSGRTINTQIMEETGMSFSNYLTFIRIQKAGEMLRDTDLDAADVAEKCGFTISTFYRIFKKYYNIAPAEYKAQFRK